MSLYFHCQLLHTERRALNCSSLSLSLLPILHGERLSFLTVFSTPFPRQSGRSYSKRFRPTTEFLSFISTVPGEADNRDNRIFRLKICWIANYAKKKIRKNLSYREYRAQRIYSVLFVKIITFTATIAYIRGFHDWPRKFHSSSNRESPFCNSVSRDSFSRTPCIIHPAVTLLDPISSRQVLVASDFSSESINDTLQIFIPLVKRLSNYCTCYCNLNDHRPIFEIVSTRWHLCLSSGVV